MIQLGSGSSNESKLWNLCTVTGVSSPKLDTRAYVPKDNSVKKWYMVFTPGGWIRWQIYQTNTVKKWKRRSRTRLFNKTNCYFYPDRKLHKPALPHRIYLWGVARLCVYVWESLGGGETADNPGNHVKKSGIFPGQTQSFCLPLWRERKQTNTEQNILYETLLFWVVTILW